MSDADVDWYTEPFWEALADGEFRVGHCDSCEERHFPPAPVCPTCGAEARMAAAAGTGTLYSFTRQHRTAPGFDEPTVIGIVELADGPRVLMRLDADYDDLELGQEVTVVATDYEADYDRGRTADYPMFAARPD